MSDGTTYYYCQICNLGVLHTRHPDCQVCAYVAAARADERAKVIEGVEDLLDAHRNNMTEHMFYTLLRGVQALATRDSDPELKQGG